MNTRRKIKLMITVPFMEKGSEFWLYDATAEVYWIDRDGKVSEYPLRPGLAGYLWLLATEPKYIKILETHHE